METNFKVERTGNNYFEWNNIQKHQNLYTATLKINPAFDDNNFIKEITLKIYYPESQSIFQVQI